MSFTPTWARRSASVGTQLFPPASNLGWMSLMCSSPNMKNVLSLPKTGLLYHAWDQDRNAAWADPATGRSPIIWGRGMGWFVMAMVDILEQFPPSHRGYPRLHTLLKKNVAGLAKTQDPRTGLWFQRRAPGAAITDGARS